MKKEGDTTSHCGFLIPDVPLSLVITVALQSNFKKTSNESLCAREGWGLFFNLSISFVYVDSTK